jgi:tryptophan-rich sensory protein
MPDASLGRHVIVIPAATRWRVHRQKAGAWSLAGIGVLTAIAASIGAMASAGAQGFYLDLARPAWAPPPSVFAPVWTILYAMMAVAVWLVVRKQRWHESAPLLALYAFHLGINALWTWCFFAWQSGSAAVFDIALLWVLVAMMVVFFARIEKKAGMLLLPYLAWVTYALALTVTVWRMNPEML